MKKSFSDLGIIPPILKALEEMGFESPTEVQSRAIPHILNKEDIIVKSKTGSGKTAVFGVSMLQMADAAAQKPQGLILTPTRELAVQIDNDLRQISKHLKLKTTAVYGQHSMNSEIKALNMGASIVTGTPGRVYDHISQGNLLTRNIRCLVLDEADRMLDMGFIGQVLRIIKTIPKDRITLLFSATIPDEINRICTSYMKHPTTIEIDSDTKTVDTTEQFYYRTERNEKRAKLNKVLLNERPDSCMIFCNTKIAVNRVQNFLMRKGYSVKSLHGDIPQSKRMETMQQFKQGKFNLLVATDVAARGIHIDGLSLVINYDVPVEKDSYIHRIGRTGRAGNIGRAVTLVTGDDIMSLYEIEEHIKVIIPERELPDDSELENHKDEISKWKKANSSGNTPSGTIADASGKQLRNKPSRSGRSSQYKGKEQYGKSGRSAKFDRTGKIEDSGKYARTGETVHSNKSGQNVGNSRYGKSIQPERSGQSVSAEQPGKSGQSRRIVRKSNVKRGNRMKSIIVYYSWTGNTEVVADAIRKFSGDDIRRLEEAKPRKKGIGFAKAAVSALFGSKSKLKPMNFSLDSYDILYLGSPVWANHSAPAINSFISKADLSGKSVYLFLTQGDDKNPQIVIDAISKRIEKRGGKVVDSIFVTTEMNKVITPEAVGKPISDWLSKGNKRQ